MSAGRGVGDNPVHHVELWTHDLAEVEGGFDWLLTQLGWATDHDPAWPQGRTWTHPTGVYLVLEQSPAVDGATHDRSRPGLNHLALRLGEGDLDRLRDGCAAHGWRELFAETYPHAGGPDHVALYVENAQGFEIEVVSG